LDLVLKTTKGSKSVRSDIVELGAFHSAEIEVLLLTNQIANKQSYLKFTLPISTDDGLYMNSEQARALGEDLCELYGAARPFPHIVIDNFLPEKLIEEITSSFPGDLLPQDTLYENEYTGLHKRQVYPEDCENKVRRVFHFLNSAPILQFLEGLTAIHSLIGDPYFQGGGFHEIRRGGKLRIHADFRVNERLHLIRRVNLLLYLNKGWDIHFGGALELWDAEMKSMKQSIDPLFNRCVIFNTNSNSYHGHPDPLKTPDGLTRRSIALYYYTASDRVYEEEPPSSTVFFARPEEQQIHKWNLLVLRIQNQLKDWTPPVVFRAAIRLKSKLKR